MPMSNSYIQMFEKNLSNSYFSSPAHISVIWILYPSARENKQLKSTQPYSKRQHYYMRSFRNAVKN